MGCSQSICRMVIGRIVDGVRRGPGLRFHEQGSDAAVQLERIEEHDRGVDGRHAQPHGNHDQRLQHPLAAEVDQQEAQGDQTHAGNGQLGMYRKQGGHTLKNVI